MGKNLDMIFVVPSFKPRMKEESIGTLILAKKALLNKFNVEIARYWDVDKSPKVDYTNFSNDFVNHILDKSPKIVGFYCRCEEYHISIDLAQKIKVLSPATKIVFGGPQAELVAQETIKAYNHIDYISCSEGENTIVPLIDWIINKHSNLSEAFTIPGLTYRNEKGIVCQNPLPNFLPDNYSRGYFYYDLIPDKVWDNTKSVAIDVGRGCPFSCTFCSTKTFWKRKYRLRNISDVIGEMKYLLDTYGIRNFDFKHDLFTVNKKRIMQFCDEILDLGISISWGCDSRIGAIDTEMIDKMVKSGLTNIFFGIESGSKEMQDKINKHLNLQEADKIILYCLQKQLKVTTSFIYGFPEETQDNVSDTMKLAVKFQNYGCNVLTNLCHIMNGTELYERFRDSLYFSDNTAYNQCVIGLGDLKEIYINHLGIFAHLCDFPNDLRGELSYFDSFRYSLNFAYKNMPKQHQLLVTSDYASISMYRKFCKSNKCILGEIVPSSDGNVTTTRTTLKHVISDEIYEKMVNNLVEDLYNESR